MATEDFQTLGQNRAAPFTLKLHRGEGMTLLAMNWIDEEPPADFVGFAIEYKEPKGKRYFAVKNRLNFLDAEGEVNPNQTSTLLSPIQMFRWVHFPRNAELPGEFTYRVTPVFMNELDELSHGEAQTAGIVLRRETYPNNLNVTFTRGFISSQAFVDRYCATKGAIAKLLPATAAKGFDFQPTHPKAAEALAWMGFEARSAIYEVLDQALADETTEVRVVAYDLGEPEIIDRLRRLGKRLKIIIDDSKEHGEADSAETRAEALLRKSAGSKSVKRQHMGSLQHNKTIVVDGPKLKAVVCGSTNFTWRGLFVQSNNALVLRGTQPVRAFQAAFAGYWASDSAADFGATAAAQWAEIGPSGVDVSVAFSPHSNDNALLEEVANDILEAKSSVFYSLAFLQQTRGPIREAIEALTKRPDVFVYGITDKKLGIELRKPNGNVAPVYPEELGGDLPAPFKPEPSGGSGVRLHHKFIVVDFDTANARVYTGSYNFSDPADRKNGENLVRIRGQRVAVAYMIEALRIFDHYHFRVKARESNKKGPLCLRKPPRKAREKAWWREFYATPIKVRDRELFA